MSYELSIFHAQVQREVSRGLALDGFAHSLIELTDMERLIARLSLYGYEAEDPPEEEHHPAIPNEYRKQVESCPITVLIFPTQVSFSVPYWKDSEAAILEALQDACELADSATLALFNPQLAKWNEA
jgi:hypothetical protein